MLAVDGGFDIDLYTVNPPQLQIGFGTNIWDYSNNFAYAMSRSASARTVNGTNRKSVSDI